MKEIAREAIDILNSIADCGCLLPEEEEQIDILEKRLLDETIKQKEKDQAIKRIIARAAATAFAKDYCCDEILDLFPKDSTDVAWRELDKVFTNIFGMNMGAAQYGN